MRRRALDLSQASVSRLAGCGVVFLYSVERGKPALRLDKLLSVLEVLGLQLTLESGKAVLRIDEALR